MFAAFALGAQELIILGVLGAAVFGGLIAAIVLASKGKEGDD